MELKSYSPELYEKPQIVAPNKVDITESREKLEEIRGYFEKRGIPIFPISGATGEGLKELVRETGKRLEELKLEEAPEIENEEWPEIE